MTEFTPEWIAGAREVVGNDDASPSGQIAFIVLDHIERLQARVAELENSQVQEYHVPPESFNDLMEIFRQGTKDGTIIIKNLTTSNAGLKQKKIEQLEEIIQASRNRIAELEAKWKVYCTADGDYPAIGLMTIFEDYAETYIGGFDDGYWFDQNKGQLEDTVGEVYWKPLISLESQYAKQESEG